MPFLVLAAGGIGRFDGEACKAPAVADIEPMILGPAVLDADALTAWWEDQRRGQPAALATTVPDLIQFYATEGDAEGVRGDLAFAQAIHETGYFTSQDTTHNNFAGIAHPDGAAGGTPFPDPATGVRAHVQLLKKFAAGNDTELASADVAPRAGAQATTWADLAGTWAADPAYWTSISTLYEQMRSHGDQTTSEAILDTDPCQTEQDDTSEPADGQPSGPVELATVRGITVNASIADQLEELLAAAEDDGLILNGHGYRSSEQQIALREAHCGTGHYNVYEKPASHCSPPTARPGTSRHEQGLAIDFVNCSTHSTRCWQWLNENAATFGLHNLPSEPWHWSTDAK